LADQGSELLVVDNSDTEWKVERYLRDWVELSTGFDIATGYMEIGALLALDGQWQKLDKLRILMGDEVSARTKKALVAGVERIKALLDLSIERAKETNDFLLGVPAIVDALERRQIECRVYTKEKFHAKTYITHAKQAVVGSAALVGSSNFTLPGITQNVELNIQLRREVEVLQAWYERHWDEAEDITPEILNVIKRHTQEYSPFHVYAKALQEFFRGHEMTAGEWEQHKSLVYPILDQYQREGYQALMKIASQFGGAFLCDGVGLGKTFVGLMLIERLVMHDRKRVALFVPKAAREPVWEKELRNHLPDLGGDFSNLAVFSHTDLLRTGDYPERLARIKEQADVIIIDEAHHFRNPGFRGESGRKNRYWSMYDIAESKTMFMLTATPVNNRLLDLQHMIELFSRRQADYFKTAPLGIYSLPGHFRKMEKELEAAVLQDESQVMAETSEVEAEQVLTTDPLFSALVVQRSRAYVKQSQLQYRGTEATFPTREDPKVVEYSIKKTYGRLLNMMEKAFSRDKPLFRLAIYSPLAYYKGSDDSIDPIVENRQRQVVGLIRTLFLKRFESSPEAFGLSCYVLLKKLLAFVTKHSQSKGQKDRLERWKAQHGELVGYVHNKQLELLGGEPSEDEEDVITDEMLEAVEELSRDDYDVDEILAETFLDLEEIADFLDELKKFKPAHDDKLQALIKLLKSNAVLKKHKVLIFTEYMATARYLRRELERAGLTHIDETDSNDKRPRGGVIRRFAPFYNGSSSAELRADNDEETRILISTDVLSEGLNLQDATRLINYDLHWNPVRLMQRIGRVDRRLNPHVEEAIVAQRPEEKKIRGTVAYWNFIPPEDLDELLRLYQRVSHKTLRISKTFGIEGGKLLGPEDEFEALRDFNHLYEGTTSAAEEMHLEFQRLVQEVPGLVETIDSLPGRVFSGKEHLKPGTNAIFFCYSLPAPSAEDRETDEASLWREDTGITAWYLYDVETTEIIEEPAAMIDLIRSQPDTPRQVTLPGGTLSEVRAAVEKHIKNTYLKRVQAPIGVRPILKAWMELS